ncbi:BTAD domain-containing putative transcriptional regulator [Actinomadura sp. 7K507]|uniref:BTAD domain-containing putative transcriptional regulator n=1 Tax=Actinomadura sp. 7K507 TaxID=2530365 RepID=UPI00104DD215|nr:BTAD domain-containing putative transcriptional regulator [Actinomadura sp. 7K507]TDC97825.1 AfsR/SARP family transcriptional regulator [Actinomadura sp. 7K507]
MRFGVLGPVEVCADGVAVPVGGPRVRALLAMLLLDAGRVVAHERLIDGLYGDEPPDGAANALQSQVSRLRRGLGDTGLVEGHPAGYRIAVDPDDVDVHRFGLLAAGGREALAAGEFARAAGLFREALALWRGPALADLGAPFAGPQVARLDEERASVVEEYGDAAVKDGDAGAVVPALRELVDAQPLRERARATLMRALHAEGRQAEALAVFEEGRRILADELGADPSRELADVHVAILRGEGGETVRPRLPAQLTSFVGRETELRRVGKMLAAGRLVTLLGPGGAGKTRLAVEAARREDGEVCFVDLAPVDPGDVPKALLGALGLRAAGVRPVPGLPADTEERLITGLEGRRLLLVLDNCEHVVAAVAALTHRLLRACPGLRVLATSRESLGITGEALWPVPPLEPPPDGATEAELAAYPAVRLFLDRAEAVRPDFVMEGDAVGRICRALDGLPLAIELAAARLRSLPVAQVATRLDDRFRLLSRGDRTAAPRHQTLRAVVEWSWDLLDEAERTLARRLTVFSGGFTLEAAMGVCDLGDTDDTDELVAGLADKSLLQAGGDRYRMLDTVRAFCAERLAEAGETERFEEAHARYFLGLAREADPRLRGAAQLEWLGVLAAEHGNLHAALRRSVRRDPATALRLTASLTWYWLLRGRIEGASLASELLDVVGEPPEGLYEEYALCATNAVSGGVTGERAAGWLDRATVLLRRVEGPLRYPATLVMLAMISGPAADYGFFAGLDTAGQDAAGQTGAVQTGDDPWTKALLSMGAGFLAQIHYDLADAEEACAEAVRGFRACGDRWGTASSLDALAQVADLRGDRDRALALQEEALELVEQLGALEDTADLLYQRALTHLHGGDLDAAHAGYERGLEPARRAGAPEKIAGGYQGLGEVARLRGDAAGARRLYETALARCTSERFTAAEVRGSALVGLARLAAAEGDRGRALDLFHEALDASSDRPIHAYQAIAAIGLADVAVAEGDGERAARLLGFAAALRRGRIPGDPDAGRVAAAARALLGGAAYEAVFAEAAALPRPRAFALLTHR